MDEETLTVEKQTKVTKKAEAKKKVAYTAPAPSPSKRFKTLASKVEKKAYTLDEALETIKKLANAKFNESVEAHLRLGIDPKQTAQQVRGSVTLPHGTGKKLRILVFAEGPSAEEAKQAGATVADEEVTTQIEKGSVPFDLVIATPDMMPKLAKLARILGTRGLMPNPKNGTVTPSIAKAVSERSLGLVDFKNEQSLLHLTFGKVSFAQKDLKENFQTLYDVVLAAKPAKAQRQYIKNLSLSSTMGPGIKVELGSIKED
jgi:large subunit ribosomal protein L1